MAPLSGLGLEAALAAFREVGLGFAPWRNLIATTLRGSFSAMGAVSLAPAPGDAIAVRRVTNRAVPIRARRRATSPSSPPHAKPISTRALRDRAAAPQGTQGDEAALALHRRRTRTREGGPRSPPADRGAPAAAGCSATQKMRFSTHRAPERRKLMVRPAAGPRAGRIGDFRFRAAFRNREATSARRRDDAGAKAAQPKLRVLQRCGRPAAQPVTGSRNRFAAPGGRANPERG